jgi:hypothetical protein
MELEAEKLRIELEAQWAKERGFSITLEGEVSGLSSPVTPKKTACAQSFC